MLNNEKKKHYPDTNMISKIYSIGYIYIYIIQTYLYCKFIYTSNIENTDEQKVTIFNFKEFINP